MKPMNRSGHTLTILCKEQGKWVLARDETCWHPHEASDPAGLGTRGHRPCPDGGKANRVWVVTAVGDDRIEMTENGVPILLTPELNVRDSPRQSDTNPQLLRFPLTVGKRWTYTTDWLYKEKNSRGTSVVDVAVAAYEKVSVPAGELEAFRLEAKSRMTPLEIRKVRAGARPAPWASTYLNV